LIQEAARVEEVKRNNIELVKMLKKLITLMSFINPEKSSPLDSGW